MDRKIVMGVAAVAGIGLLLYMRKQGDGATLASSGALVGAGSSGSAWAGAPIVITNTKAPVVDATAAAPVANIKPPVQTAVPPAETSGFVIGGSSQNAAPFVGTPQPTVRDPNDPGRMTVSEYEASQRWLSSF